MPNANYKMAKWRHIGCVLLLFLPISAASGVTVADEPEFDVDVDAADYMNNEANNDSGVVGADVEMTGYAVINGSVWIDGVKIHKPQSVYTSKKSGKTYRIHWGKNGNVSITEE